MKSGHRLALLLWLASSQKWVLPGSANFEIRDTKAVKIVRRNRVPARRWPEVAAECRAGKTG